MLLLGRHEAGDGIKRYGADRPARRSQRGNLGDGFAAPGNADRLAGGGLFDKDAQVDPCIGQADALHIPHRTIRDQM